MYGFKNESNIFTNYEFEIHYMIDEEKIEEISEIISKDFEVEKINIDYKVVRYLIQASL